MRRTRTINAVVALAVCAVAVRVGTATLGDDDGSTDGPVIMVAGWNAYPTAEVRGQLRLVDGCLLIDDAVVFWEEGASWDAAHETVGLGHADPVQVGSAFSGGGGYYTGEEIDGLEGVDVDAVHECMHRTAASEAVIATASR